MRPANGRAASSPGTVIGLSAERVNGRVLSGSLSAGPCATPRAGTEPLATRVFSMGNGREPAAPGAASAGRAGVRISVAGRSDVPQGRVGPALLRMAPTMQLPLPSPAAAAACPSTWAGGLLFGGDGATARFQSPDVLGCLPGHRDRLARRDSTGLDQGPLLGPVVPRGASEGPAKRRPAALDGRAAGAYGPARGASVDPPPPPGMRPHGEPVPTGRIPPCDRRCPRHRDHVAPGRRHPQAVAAAPLPDSRRLSG